MQDDIFEGSSLNWYDYGARFYDPQIGRWTTKEPFAELVPGISLYAYCYDNPVNYTEPSGLWPGWVHKHIIRRALNPYIGHGLTEDQLDLIIKGGVFADKNWQTGELSYRHSMSDGILGQSVSAAKQARNDWVIQQISLFRQDGNYERLGYAIHAMSDEDAPTHSWKPWYGQSKWNVTSRIHLAGELNPFGYFSKASTLSEIKIRETYHAAKSASNTTPTPPPQPVPVLTPPTVTPP